MGESITRALKLKGENMGENFLNLGENSKTETVNVGI